METHQHTNRVRWAKPAWVIAVGAAVIAVVFLTAPVAAAAWSNATNPAVREADRHARNAGNAMLKHNLDEPASAAAAVVVGGSLPGDTIEALTADGTTRQGQVVLRITVLIVPGGYEKVHRATRCYRCHRLRSCRPEQYTTLSQALKGLTTSQRRDPATVKAALARAYHSTGVTVETAERPDGTVGVAVFATTTSTRAWGLGCPSVDPRRSSTPHPSRFNPASWGAAPTRSPCHTLTTRPTDRHDHPVTSRWLSTGTPPDGRCVTRSA